MNKNDLLLIGGGGHCRSCIDVIETENKFKIVGIVDLKENIGNMIIGYEIIGCDDDLPQLINKHKNCLITIGQIKSPQKRIQLYQYLKQYKANMPIIISPQAYVSKHANIGEGTIIMHKAVINSDAKIGTNCIINTNAIVEHDVVIGNNCHISTGVILNGGVEIGNDCFIGSGSVFREYIKVKENSFIKALSLVKESNV